ncbi:hypothetical protein J22TS1_10780 [Siminovitchia terrae]|nr:hypothetical protein J22TS1_10780 [Siminovitchia terrae]
MPLESDDKLKLNFKNSIVQTGYFMFIRWFGSLVKGRIAVPVTRKYENPGNANAPLGILIFRLFQVELYFKATV